MYSNTVVRAEIFLSLQRAPREHHQVRVSLTPSRTWRKERARLRGMRASDRQVATVRLTDSRPPLRLRFENLNWKHQFLILQKPSNMYEMRCQIWIWNLWGRLIFWCGETIFRYPAFKMRLRVDVAQYTKHFHSILKHTQTNWWAVYLNTYFGA